VVKVDGSPITKKDIKAWANVTYVHLGSKDRESFLRNTFDRVIHQVHYTTVTSKGKTNIEAPIDCTDPVLEYIAVLRRLKVFKRNNHFYFAGVDGLDPFTTMVGKSGDKIIFGGRDISYYRTMEPFYHHSRKPKKHIYVKSISVMPELIQPSGDYWPDPSEQTSIVFFLQPGLEHEECEITVMTRVMKVVRYNPNGPGTRPVFVSLSHDVAAPAAIPSTSTRSSSASSKVTPLTLLS